MANTDAYSLQSLLAALSKPKKYQGHAPGKIGNMKPSRTDLYPERSTIDYNPGIDSPSGDNPFESARASLPQRKRSDTNWAELIDSLPKPPEYASPDPRNTEGESKARGIASALTGLLSLVSGRGRDIGKNALAASLGLQQGQNASRNEYLSTLASRNKATKESFDSQMDYAKQRLDYTKFNQAAFENDRKVEQDLFQNKLDLGKAESAREIGLGNLEAKKTSAGGDPTKFSKEAAMTVHTQISQLLTDPVKMGQLPKQQRTEMMSIYNDARATLGLPPVKINTDGFPKQTYNQTQLLFQRNLDRAQRERNQQALQARFNATMRFKEKAFLNQTEFDKAGRLFDGIQDDKSTVEEYEAIIAQGPPNVEGLDADKARQAATQYEITKARLPAIRRAMENKIKYWNARNRKSGGMIDPETGEMVDAEEYEMMKKYERMGSKDKAPAQESGLTPTTFKYKGSPVTIRKK